MNDIDERDLLARALRERAEDVGGHPVGLTEVRTTARRIRRRRVAVAGAVAAVAVGAVLPVGVGVLSGAPDPSHGPAQAPSGSASPSPTATEPSAPDATPGPDGTYLVTLRGVPAGAPSREAYVLAREKQLVVDGERRDLADAYIQVVPFRDGWLALDGGQRGTEVVALDPTLREQQRHLAGGALVRNGDGTRVLAVVDDLAVPGRTVLADLPATGDPERELVTWDLPDGATPEFTQLAKPVGYVDDDAVVLEAETRQHGPAPYLATSGPEGPQMQRLTRFNRVTATSEVDGLVAGQVSYDDLTGGSCWGVAAPEQSPTELLWRTCEHALKAFSPDGRYVVGGPAQYDAWGPPGLVVLDARTGETVVELTPDPSRDQVFGVNEAVWEDADTVLASVVEGDRTGLLRVELTGHVERASDVYETTDMSLRLWFAEHPRA